MARQEEKSIQQLMEIVEEFVSERDWEKYHTPKNLAESISIESAELLEEFQWKKEKETEKNQLTPQKLDSISKEISDIMIYCFSLANTLDIDLEKAIERKIEINREKYPPEESKEKW